MSNGSEVVKGWKLVPVEPTEEMMRAAQVADCDHGDFEDWFDFIGADRMTIFEAMLAAAPQPPALGGEVEAVAHASFSDNGNIRCWSVSPEHPSLKKLESEGYRIVDLVDRAHVTRLQAEVERLTEADSAYDEAISASNELGYACMSAADVIRHQADELVLEKARTAELDGLLRAWRHGKNMTLKQCAELTQATDAALNKTNTETAQ